jgi:hypothetical protein
VLGAFGIIAGGYGSLNSVMSAALLLKPPEEFAKLVEEHNQFWAPQLPKDDVERYSKREAEVSYGRRKAALPLAAVGLIVSCLLFAGCIRSMMGDPSGPGLWSLASAVSLPYQLLAMALALLTLRDFSRALGPAPSLLQMALDVRRLGILVTSGIAMTYFGACLLFLRSARGPLSGGRGRTPPSA